MGNSDHRADDYRSLGLISRQQTADAHLRGNREGYSLSQARAKRENNGININSTTADDDGGIADHGAHSSPEGHRRPRSEHESHLSFEERDGCR